MALTVNTNIGSIIAQNNLQKNQTKLTDSINKLSSGLRINSAKDDAAGLASSEKLKGQIASISVASRNAQDGISLAQTAEGGLDKIGNILVRMKELVTKSANGTLGDSERKSLDEEYQGLIEEINRISSSTEFNGIKLLDGSQSATGVTLQVGFNNVAANDRITFFSGMAAINSSTLSLGADISTMGAAQSNLDLVASAIGEVASARGKLGVVMNRLEFTIENLATTSQNLQAANSAIRDADFALETATFTKYQIMAQAGTSVLAQGNMVPQMALTLLG